MMQHKIPHVIWRHLTPTQSKAGFQSAPRQCLHEKHNKQFLCSNGDDCSASFKLLPYLVRANFLRSEPYDSVFFSLSNVTFEKNFWWPGRLQSPPNCDFLSYAGELTQPKAELQMRVRPGACLWGSFYTSCLWLRQWSIHKQLVVDLAASAVQRTRASKSSA